MKPLKNIIQETIFEVLNEELCARGKAYIKARKAAGEKSSAYLSGRAVKVCKGQISFGGKKTKSYKEEINASEAYNDGDALKTVIDNKRKIEFIDLNTITLKDNFHNIIEKNNLGILKVPLNEYNNVGYSPPKTYIVKDDGTYKEVPIKLLSKISNLTYDMGGGETNYYPEKNIVIVDNIPIEEFVKDPGEIKDEKIYVEYNLNQPYSFPKANKILVSQVVYHLDDIKSFAKTVANSLKDGGVIEFFSDVMSKKDKIFLEYLSSEFGFGVPSTLSKYKNSTIKITTNKYVPPTEYYIYEVIDDVGNISKISTTKKGFWWKYVKVEGNLNFKPIEGLNPEHFNQLGLEPNEALKKQLDQFSDILGHNITNIKKLNQITEFRPIKEDESLHKSIDILTESLRNWFEKEDWVRIDTQGNITGPCGTMKKGKATTRCLPRAKANSLTKAQRAATARKKVAGSKQGKQFVSNTPKAKVKFRKK